MRLQCSRPVTWLLALAVALGVAATPGALAQDETTPITLTRFISPAVGVEGVAPEGWAETRPGWFERDAMTALFYDAVQGVPAETILSSLAAQLGQRPVEPEGSVASADLAWDWYKIEFQAQGQAYVIDLALAESDTFTYVAGVQTAALDQYDLLHQAVFLPALEALKPLVLDWGQGSAPPASDATPVTLAPEVISVRPHDPQAFTQGLILYEGLIYESTGHYGESTLRAVDPQTGEVLRAADVPEAYFAEGLERVGDRLIQLTWKEEKAFVYDLETFAPVGVFDYEGEGWGLCYDGETLFRSDGSAVIALHDPETFEVVAWGRVTLQGVPVERLNELECVGDYLYANVWQSDAILKIDKTNGNVVAIVDASGLLTPEEAAQSDVLNGIAYDPETDTFLITGKNWPKVFEVRFVEREK